VTTFLAARQSLGGEGSEKICWKGEGGVREGCVCTGGEGKRANEVCDAPSHTEHKADTVSMDTALSCAGSCCWAAPSSLKMNKAEAAAAATDQASPMLGAEPPS